MMANIPLHRRFSAPITALVVFCLLFAGMRVPDYARPYRPKPNQRAVIEVQVKPSQDNVNKASTFIAILAKSPEIRTPLTYRQTSVCACNATECPALFPNSSRAPPFFLS